MQLQREGSFRKEDWRLKPDLKWSDGQKVRGMARHTGCRGKSPTWGWSGLLKPTGALTLVTLPTPFFLPQGDSSFIINPPHTHLLNLALNRTPSRSAEQCPMKDDAAHKGGGEDRRGYSLMLLCKCQQSSCWTRALTQPLLKNGNTELIITVSLQFGFNGSIKIMTEVQVWDKNNWSNQLL